MRKIQSLILCKIASSQWIQKKCENAAVAYIVESFTRIISRNPKWTNITIIITGIICAAIISICKALTPTAISVNIDTAINYIVGTFATSIAAYGQTTVQPEIKGLDPSGKVIKEDVAITRPFTAIAECEAATKIQANISLAAKGK